MQSFISHLLTGSDYRYVAARLFLVFAVMYISIFVICMAVDNHVASKSVRIDGTDSYAVKTRCCECICSKDCEE